MESPTDPFRSRSIFSVATVTIRPPSRSSECDAAVVDVDAPAVPGRLGDDHPGAGGGGGIDEQIAAVARDRGHGAAVVGAFAGRERRLDPGALVKIARGGHSLDDAVERRAEND